MNLLITACVLIGVLMIADAYIARQEFEEYKGDDLWVSDKGKCECWPEGCTCAGWDDGVKITATFSVKEFRDDPKSNAVIEADIDIGKENIVKEFPANKLEGFCDKVNGKRFCFGIDVLETTTSQSMHACFKLSKPHPVDLGCFKLPLMADDWTIENADYSE